MTDTNLARFRVAVAGALSHLESRRREINDLNVFPVADGDTGDNMALTLRAVLDELDQLGDGGRTIDEIGREEIVQSVARAALLGARGNSGVILSQLIRGAAEELASRPGELIDPTLIAAALAHAADRAYASVREPAEGTILTVAREMAHQMMTDIAHGPDSPRLGPDAAPALQDRVIAETLERALVAGQDSVARGPELLAALREAGVVDAGGYALTIAFAGVVAALRGEDEPAAMLPRQHAAARITRPEHNSITYRYCTNFAVTGQDLEPSSFLAGLEALGDSVLVVGDSTTLKVHLHTDEPERATEVFAAAGAVSRLDIADMRAQVAERSARLAGGGVGGVESAVEVEVEVELGLDSAGQGAGTGNGAHALPGESSASAAVAATDGPAGGAPGASGSSARPRCGAVAVVNGEGLRELFESLGVATVDGGPTMSPSTLELLAAIHALDAEEVVVLPNGARGMLAAERAARLSERLVSVVACTSQQAGLAAAVALAGDRGAAENAAALQDALAGLRTGAVAQAARDDREGRFRRGDAVGFVEQQLVAWGDVQGTLGAVLRDLSEGAELISAIEGLGAPLDAGAVAGLSPEGVELEQRVGGQPGHWWLLVAE